MRSSNIYIDEWNLIRKEKYYKAAFCCCYFPSKVDYEGILSCLHSQERSYYKTLQFEKRAKSYLIGRFTAKQAVATLTGEDYLSDIIIQSGIFNQPVVISEKPNIQVSITHCNNFGAAIAFSEAHPFGIDIEEVDPNKAKFLEGQITIFEKERIKSLRATYDAGLMLLWTAKEVFYPKINIFYVFFCWKVY